MLKHRINLLHSAFAVTSATAQKDVVNGVVHRRTGTVVTTTTRHHAAVHIDGMVDGFFGVGQRFGQFTCVFVGLVFVVPNHVFNRLRRRSIGFPGRLQFCLQRRGVFLGLLHLLHQLTAAMVHFRQHPLAPHHIVFQPIHKISQRQHFFLVHHGRFVHGQHVLVVGDSFGLHRCGQFFLGLVHGCFHRVHLLDLLGQQGTFLIRQRHLFLGFGQCTQLYTVLLCQVLPCVVQRVVGIEFELNGHNQFGHCFGYQFLNVLDPSGGCLGVFFVFFGREHYTSGHNFG